MRRGDLRAMCHPDRKKASQSRNEGDFKCKLCSKVHQMPEEGFPVSKQLSKLLSEQPAEVIRGKLFEALKERLDQLQKAVQESFAQLQLGIDEVSEHCYQLRNQV